MVRHHAEACARRYSDARFTQRALAYERAPWSLHLSSLIFTSRHADALRGEGEREVRGARLRGSAGAVGGLNNAALHIRYTARLRRERATTEV